MNRAAYVNPLTNPVRLSFLLQSRKYKHEIWLQFPCHQKPQQVGECHGMANTRVFADWSVYRETGKTEHDFPDSWTRPEREDPHRPSWRESTKNESNGKEIAIG